MAGGPPGATLQTPFISHICQIWEEEGEPDPTLDCIKIQSPHLLFDHPNISQLIRLTPFRHPPDISQCPQTAWLFDVFSEPLSS